MARLLQRRSISVGPRGTAIAKPLLFSDTEALRGLRIEVDAALSHLGEGTSIESSTNIRGTKNGKPGHAPQAQSFHDEGTLIFRSHRGHQLAASDLLSSLPRSATFLERQRALRAHLPAHKLGHRFLDVLSANDVVVLTGETGSGKTTQLPQLAIDWVRAGSGVGGRVVCTQPRRISAVSVAERVAFERGVVLGGEVGYQVRFDTVANNFYPRSSRRSSALRAGERMNLPSGSLSTTRTELLYCTTGILLRKLQSDPFLEQYSCVFVDEAHERDVNCDLLLMFLRDLVAKRRRSGHNPLKVVLMSASMDSGVFVRYFREPIASSGSISGLTTSLFEIPGKTNFPISEYWLGDMEGSESSGMEGENTGGHVVMETTGGRGASALKFPAPALPPPKFAPGLVVKAMEFIEDLEVREGAATPGAVLVFVPGWEEIKSTIDELTSLSTRLGNKVYYKLLPLHSAVRKEEQKLIFETTEGSRSPMIRKIIVSTNIGETSLTIPDVVHVIDSGLHKQKTYCPETNTAGLETCRIAKPNVRQRRGRAGRCRPGKFFKLYSEQEFVESFPDREKPEMQRTPVQELVLQTLALVDSCSESSDRCSVEQILANTISPPSERSVALSVAQLRLLGCLSVGFGGGHGVEQLTPLGRRLQKFALHPVLSRFLLLGRLLLKEGERSFHRDVAHTAMGLGGSSCKNIFAAQTSDLRRGGRSSSGSRGRGARTMHPGKEQLSLARSTSTIGGAAAGAPEQRNGDGLLSDHLVLPLALGRAETAEREGRLAEFCAEHSMDVAAVKACWNEIADLPVAFQTSGTNFIPYDDIGNRTTSEVGDEPARDSLSLLRSLLAASLTPFALFPGAKRSVFLSADIPPSSADSDISSSSRARAAAATSITPACLREDSLVSATALRRLPARKERNGSGRRTDAAKSDSLFFGVFYNCFRHGDASKSNVQLSLCEGTVLGSPLPLLLLNPLLQLKRVAGDVFELCGGEASAVEEKRGEVVDDLDELSSHSSSSPVLKTKSSNPVGKRKVGENSILVSVASAELADQIEELRPRLQALVNIGLTTTGVRAKEQKLLGLESGHPLEMMQKAFGSLRRVLESSDELHGNDYGRSTLVAVGGSVAESEQHELSSPSADPDAAGRRAMVLLNERRGSLSFRDVFNSNTSRSSPRQNSFQFSLKIPSLTERILGDIQPSKQKAKWSCALKAVRQLGLSL